MTSEQIAAGRRAADSGDFAGAVSILRPLAEAGTVDAQFELGRLVLTECELLSGREAFRWLHAAAGQGHPQAMYEVATYPSFPREPFESPLDGRAAWGLLLRAAEAGVGDAQYEAGASLATGEFRDGHPLTPDPVAALDWYRRASESGHVEAQFNLGVMLLEGEGCAANRAEALRWLRAAAAAGDEQARRLLSDLGVGKAE
jgi:hypothetical protein